MTGGGLEGLRVLMLRPPRPQDPLVAGLEAAGAEVLCLPLLRIEPVPADPAGLTAAAAAQWIFVSRHAVLHGMAAVTAAGHGVTGRTVYAVGAATAAALRADWRIAAHYPPQPDTEGLLALPDLQAGALSGQEIVIFRGVGGRDVLARELRARGARVTCCEVYRQVAEHRWRDRICAELARPGPLVAVAHSGSLVRALRAVLDQMPVATPVPPCLVPGARVAAAARRLGLKPLVAASALAGEMEREVRRWYTPAA